ncbi:MAG: agmatinase family protein [Bacteroidales bacterium]|nr:agmatinase family protein [Bacteroidales bacterium]MDD2424606.1 agmatinase family protein [Bacteroidales bacterium]MDD4638577.1 agmatinase family protein [Bacteroidales bacterium]
MKEFDPNDIGIANGNFFALPYNVSESDIVLISVPWDVTTSYRDGTHKGPMAIMDASLQVDLFDPLVPDAWETRIGTLKEEIVSQQENSRFRKIASQVIEELGEGADQKGLVQMTDSVNRASLQLNKSLYHKAKEYIGKGKIIGVVGGDHSVPLGAIKAVAEKYENFGILHIDAHADLRKAYEGFRYSHASIMYNSLNEIKNITALTQVGVRDFCQQENDMIMTDPRINCFTDSIIRKNSFDGGSFSDQCKEIIATLPDNVYISFDIDGLSPGLCPNTGTPVPGGLSFREADYLLWQLATSGKRIAGFDLCEVSPSENDEWDANVGARILFKLCIYTGLNLKSFNV